MSTPAFRIQPARRPVLPDADTAETKFWKSFKAPLLVKENNAINHVHFNPASPHDLAFTSSTRVQILSARTGQVHKTFSKFKDTVYSGEFRPDGKLLVAGDATGLIQAFDTTTRAVLVTLKPTSHAVHVTKFHPTERSTLLSASDDRVVRLWDLTSPDPLVEFSGHDDYIRSAGFVASSNLIVSGCYDGYVRLYDPRTPDSVVAKYYQQDPVESVLALSDSTLASAGGPQVMIWDLTAGKRVATLANFQKTVTCLASAGERGLLSGSLDGHIKVFDTSDPKFAVKFGWKYGGPVLSAGISPDLRQVAAGLTSGLLSVRTRKSEPKTPNKAAKPKSKAYAKMIRGAEYRGELEAQVIKTAQKPNVKLRPYEKHIKAFRWGDALDAAFKSGISADQTIMVMEELRSRGKIAVSLSNRDEAGLEPLLRWATKAVYHPRALPIIADWVGAILNMYTPLIEKSPLIGGLVTQLSQKVTHQIDRAREAQNVEGMLAMLMA